MSTHSQARLESRLTEAIGMLIVQGDIKNPDLNTFTSITRVDLSADNGYATVFLTNPLGEKVLEKSVAALQSAHGFIQTRVGMFMKTKNTPVLTFKADTAFIEGEKVNQLIDSLKTTNGN